MPQKDGITGSEWFKRIPIFQQPVFFWGNVHLFLSFGKYSRSDVAFS